MHPALALLVSRPQLLMDHAQAYAALFNEEFGLAYIAWQRRTLLRAVALCCLGVAAVLAGVAVMLAATWGITANTLWVWVLTPAVPLLVAILCLLLARQPAQDESFGNLIRQLHADIALLRAAGPP